MSIITIELLKTTRNNDVVRSVQVHVISKMDMVNYMCLRLARLEIILLFKVFYAIATSIAHTLSIELIEIYFLIGFVPLSAALFIVMP